MYLKTKKCKSQFNPLHHHISLYILRTVIYTFPQVLTRRICLKNQELLHSVIIIFTLVSDMCDPGVTL